jgi:hypothetical protein
VILLVTPQFLNTGRGRPGNSQSRYIGTALRNAGVLACGLRHRPGAILQSEPNLLRPDKVHVIIAP